MTENKTKGTVYQELNKMLNLDGFGNQDINQQLTSSAATEKAKIIIKGNSPQEIEKRGLELQQKKDLQNKFFRTTDRGFQKALQYEAARLPAYIDYEGMEYYPLISSALDLFMEETTTIGLNGKMLNIYSNKERIKYHLDEFFYDIVNVNVNLPFWARNLPIKYDSMIPLLNGETITIKELSERMKENPNSEMWTYSIQNETNKIVPGKIVWCDLTRKNSEILRITFDDGTYVETTPDHEYMLRNGNYVRADELTIGASLMPFYTLTSGESDGILGYEKVYNPSSNHHLFTHRMVAGECVINLDEELGSGDKFITHHVDFNKKNNNPSNLKRMTTNDHSTYHNMLSEKGKIILQRDDVKKNRMVAIDKYLRSESRKNRLSKEMMGIYPKHFNEYNNSQLHTEHNSIRKNRMTELWSNDNYRNDVKRKMQLCIDDKCLRYIINILKKCDSHISVKKLGKLLSSSNEFMMLFKIANNKIRKDLSKSLSSTTLVKLIFRKTQKNYCDFVAEINPNIIYDKNFKMAIAISKKRNTKISVLNHKVVSIDKLTEKCDVYCMEVVGKNNEQDRHNFPVCSKNEKGEFTRNGVFLSNCKYGDNFILLYGERKRGITHVKQLVNYEIERLERILNGKPIVKFKERMTGDEFNTFEIAHFRLLGDDKFIPYGSSILNKVRRVFRMLVMAEDAMLTYRIVRAGEKKIFTIDVGNIDEDDIEDYIYKVATKFKKTAQVSPNDGQIDYRFNILGNHEDYFLPQRNANSQTKIETLPGADNLDKIADIEYLRDSMFIGLGVPKPFLSFQDAAGGGKNLAQYDIRFSKKINRIQQALVQELNKMAMIHLYLLGYSGDDLKDFTLTLTNPSVQQELLKAELLREKAQTYTELTRSENGIAAMSHTSAKRLVFNMSDNEIVQDLKQQKMEMVIKQELADSPITIKKTGLFTDIDNRFGEPVEGLPLGGDTGTTGQDGMPPEGGVAPEMGGGMPPSPSPEMGGGMPPSGTQPVGGLTEPMGGGTPPLAESNFSDNVSMLVFGNTLNSEHKKKGGQKKIISENNVINDKLNKSAEQMISEINMLLEKTDTINTHRNVAEIDDINIDDIENITISD